jgi:CMP-N-acetylneuraminic acid synthetase
MTETIAVVPARGGSKGLPGKNLRSLAGMPLIEHSLRLAALCPEIARTVVSTDSESIAGVARAAGAEVLERSHVPTSYSSPGPTQTVSSRSPSPALTRSGTRSSSGTA